MIKEIINDFRVGLSLLGAIFLFFALLYDYNTSSLEYRSGVVTDVKTGGKSKGHSGVVRYCNFKIEGDTTTYGYYFGIPSVVASIMGVKHKTHIQKGDKVGFWFKSGKKNRYELYMTEDPESIRYGRYSIRKLSLNQAYVINIRGLSANEKIILKPQYYNYAQKGMYYPMLFVGSLAIILPIALIISFFIKPTKRS